MKKLVSTLIIIIALLIIIIIALLTTFSFAEVNNKIEYTVEKESYFMTDGDLWVKMDDFVNHFGTEYPFERKTFMKGDFISLKNAKQNGIFIKETADGFIISNQSFGVADYNIKKSSEENNNGFGNQEVFKLEYGDFLIEGGDTSTLQYGNDNLKRYKLLIKKDLFIEYFGSNYPLEIRSTINGDYVIIRENIEGIYFTKTKEGLLMSKQSFKKDNYNIEKGKNDIDDFSILELIILVFILFILLIIVIMKDRPHSIYF